MSQPAESTASARYTVTEPTSERPGSVPASQPVPSFLDAVLEQSPASADSDSLGSSVLSEFLSADSFEQQLGCWLKQSGLEREACDRGRIARRLNRDIAQIDTLLSRQINAILHHERFQKLEASWRGLWYLVDQVEEGSNVKVRMLNCTWNTLVRDLDRSIEFDQSQLFKKVYSQEFGTPGGEPISVLLGDFEMGPLPAPGNPISDLDALRLLSQVSAASFAPFITAAQPSLFGLNHFSELQRPMNLAAIFEQPEYVKWRSLRESEDSRFLGLVLPRVLMRLPYPDTPSRVDGFRFREDVSDKHQSGFLWGNAAYAFGAVMARAFAQSGWLADIRGVRQDRDEAGLVTDLPIHEFGTDSDGVVLKTSTEVMITDHQEKELGELGFMSLCDVRESPYSAFYSVPSVQKATAYHSEDATSSARLSSMMHYLLCVSRMAHYLKVMGRDKVGSFMEATDCQTYLNDWLQKYITQDDEAPQEFKARYPLRDAQAQVREQPGRPGHYSCTIHLQPHYQLDGMISAVRLTTELSPASG